MAGLTINLPDELSQRLQRVARELGEDPAQDACACVSPELAGVEESGARQRHDVLEQDPLLALLDQWDAEDASRTGKSTPPPVIPPFAL